MKKKVKTLEIIDEGISSFIKSKKHKDLKEVLGYTALFSSFVVLGKALRW